MDKKQALFLTASIVFVLVGNYLFFTSLDSEAHLERVIVAHAIDGDTLDLDDGRRVRLLNINTPEKKEFGYEEARASLARLENTTVSLEITGTEKYGRYLGRVYTPGYFNKEIVAEGNARMFLVDAEEVDLFNKAQQEAYHNGRGIWQRSPYYSCLRVEIDKKDEFLDIERICNASLVGWTIQDESTKRYTIKQEPAQHFKVFSKEGTSVREELYWSAGNVWNNDRDSVFIRDKNGFLVYYTSYGY